ncbi:MAG: hypothetical protein ACK5RO_08165 [Pseudobdellovibrionaceae bacterium]
MVKRLSRQILILILLSGASSAQIPQGARHWLEKPPIQSRLDEREILVLCNRASDSWKLKGAGRVSLPEEFLEAKLVAFEELKELTDLVKEARWEPKTQKLQVRFEGWGFAGTSTLKIDFRAQQNLLNFEIIEGAFLGMKGHLEYRAAKQDSWQLEFYGEYSGKFLGFFDFFAPIAVEGVLDYVATSTRSRWEKEYARSLAHKK